MVTKHEADIPVTPSSGNVFADLGFVEPALGQDVEIVVKAKPRNRERGRIQVVGSAHP